MNQIQMQNSYYNAYNIFVVFKLFVRVWGKNYYIENYLGLVIWGCLILFWDSGDLKSKHLKTGDFEDQFIMVEFKMAAKTIQKQDIFAQF